MAYIGNAPGFSTQRIVTTFTATAGQTSFSPTGGYILNYVDAYYNGVKLVAGDDFTATNGTSIVLTVAASVGDVVEIVSYVPRGLSDGYTKVEADARYEPIDSAYTKAESDARYEPLDSAYTKAEADAKYALLGANTDITSLNPDYITFDQTAVVTDAVGRLTWDSATGSLRMPMTGGNAVASIGQTMHAYVTNAESFTINKGQPVYLYQAQGDRATVKLAANTSDATSAKTLGLAAENIGANQTGYVICQGVISNVDTSAFSPGVTLYLGSTAGSLTSTKPVAPNHLVYIGVVERANAGGGQIYVRPQNGYELGEIHDVLITSPADGQVLTYDGTTSLWKNQAPTSSFTTLSASGNFTLSGGTANGVLYLNASKVATSGTALTFDGTSLGMGNPTVYGTRSLNSYTGTTASAIGFSQQISGFGDAFVGANNSGSSVLGMATGTFGQSTPNNIPWTVSAFGSEQMRLTSTGLGIGTSSPNYSLTSYKGGAVANYLQVASGATGAGAGNGLLLGVDSSGNSIINAQGAVNLYTYVAGVLRTTINSSGNLGLGVSPSAWGNAWRALQVQGYSVSTLGNAEANVSLNAYNDNNGWLYIGSDFATQYRQGSGTHRWYTAPSGTAGNAISFVESFRIGPSGQIGLSGANYGTAGQVLTSNGSGSAPSWQNAGGGTPTLNIVSGTSQTAVASNHYVLTNASTTTLTLPASPSAGAVVWVTVENNRTDNVIARNGQNIESIADDLLLDDTQASLQLRYVNATIGWVLI